MKQSKSTKAKESPPFEDQNFKQAVKQILSVPKEEVERRIEKCGQVRENKKAEGKKHKHFAPRVKVG